MEGEMLCGHCQTPAVAELDGDLLCAGCLMNILMCLEEPLPIKPLPGSDGGVSVKGVPLDLKHIYQDLA
jgi:hypothetical protein